MKKLKYILSALAVIVSLSSCIEDAELTGVMTESKKQEIAETNPDKVFASQVTGMYTDIQSYVYSDMSHNYFGQKSFDYLTSLMGNDMCMTGQFAMSLYHYLCDYWQENYVPTANRWREYYTAISNANSILKTIDPATTNEANKKYRAIAYAFRGYAYLHLSYLYQYSYQVGVDGTKWPKGGNYANSPLVPLVLEETTEDQPRSTVEVIMNQIISDLTTAYNTFAEIGMTKTADPTDFDGTVAAMYLARTYMIMNQWDNALKYAQVVCDNYPVLNATQAMQGFSDISLPDVVFGADITADNSTVYMSWFSQMDSFSDGYAGIGVWRVAFKPLVDRIADDDVRLDWFVTSRNLNTNPSIAILDSFGTLAAYYQSLKFVGCGRDNLLATGSSAGWELGDYIYLRSEEAYLMKAEILAHKGDLAGSANVLNTFMKTRQPSYNYTAANKADLIEEIIFQKRVEFWGEGLEYLDNRRLNIPVDRTVAGSNHYPAAKFKYNQEDRQFLYQIPLSEIESNKAITEADQN